MNDQKKLSVSCNEYEGSNCHIGYNEVIGASCGYFFECPLCHKHHKITNPEYIKELNKYFYKHIGECTDIDEDKHTKEDDTIIDDILLGVILLCVLIMLLVVLVNSIL